MRWYRAPYGVPRVRATGTALVMAVAGRVETCPLPALALPGHMPLARERHLLTDLIGRLRARDKTRAGRPAERCDIRS